MKTLTIISFLLLSAQVCSQEILKPIAPKFTPDPVVIEGEMEGTIPLAGLRNNKSNCGGFGSHRPNYVLTLRSSFAYLNLKLKGEGLVLLVQGPDGTFCRQDNPELSGSWRGGTYQIWIGTRQRNKTRYRLSVSESDQ